MKKTLTLSEWLIQNTDGEAYRSGRLSGWKHPVVNKNMIDAVGGLQTLLKQAENLESNPLFGQMGKFRADWRDMGRDIKKIDYEISIIPQLCRLEGMEDPREHQIKLLERVHKWEEQVKGQAWILPFYEKIIKKLENGKSDSDAEDELVFRCLNTIVLLKEDLWERQFSSQVFHDSKKFKKMYSSRMFTILSHYSPYYEDGMKDYELFAMHKIHSYAQTLELKGPMQYRIDGTFSADTSVYPYGTILNAQTIEHAVPQALLGVKTIMTIENKANYEAMPYSEDMLYIFCHGYFSPKEVKFLNKICDAADKECQFLHWGDLDYGGINIFLFNKQSVFPALMPYKMDTAHFKEALKLGAGIPLEASTRKKLEKKDAGILWELKEIILETNMIIEQETFL